MLTDEDFAKTREKFLPDETKSSGNTVCINEYFVKYDGNFAGAFCEGEFWGSSYIVPNPHYLM